MVTFREPLKLGPNGLNECATGRGNALAIKPQRYLGRRHDIRSIRHQIQDCVAKFADPKAPDVIAPTNFFSGNND